MSSSNFLKYINGVVICHGLSEVCLVRYIASNLHLQVKQFSKNNGKNSIQINSLMNVLNSTPFKSMSDLLKKYTIETKGRGYKKELLNFKLFIIMDTDDCKEIEKKNYINKEMFKGHWLYNYIVPIYNIENMDDVMFQSGISKKQIKDSDKGPFYCRIFPINDKPLSDNTICEVKTLKNKISSLKSTNLDDFISYCLLLINCGE